MGGSMGWGLHKYLPPAEAGERQRVHVLALLSALGGGDSEAFELLTEAEQRRRECMGSESRRAGAGGRSWSRTSRWLARWT